MEWSIEGLESLRNSIKGLGLGVRASGFRFGSSGCRASGI